MRTLGVICARGNSRGLKDKNIVNMNGKPLVWHSIHAAKNSELLTRCVISTDSRKIATIARRCGGDVPFLRPDCIATDTSRIEEALIHALKFCEESERREYDMVCLLQNSSPLRSSDDIDWCISLLAGHMGDADSVASACLVGNHECLKLKEISETGYFQAFGANSKIYRRQDVPSIYTMNGAVYVVKRDYLLEHGKVIGDRCLPYIMDKHRSMDVHDEWDLVAIEAVAGKQNEPCDSRNSRTRRSDHRRAV